MAEDPKRFDGMFSRKPSSKWQVQQSSHTHPKIKKNWRGSYLELDITVFVEIFQLYLVIQSL
jgi:hypothetical protein